MKRINASTFTLLTIYSVLLASLFPSCSTGDIVNQDQVFNSDRKFMRDSVPGAENPEYNDSGWMTVDLPYDVSIMNLPGNDGEDLIGPFSKESPGNGNSAGHVLGGTGQYETVSFLPFIRGRKLPHWAVPGVRIENTGIGSREPGIAGFYQLLL